MPCPYFIRFALSAFLCAAFLPLFTFGNDTLTSSAGSDSLHSDSIIAAPKVVVERMTVSAKAGTAFHPSVTTLTSDDFVSANRDLSTLLEGVAGVAVRRAGAPGEYSEASIRGGSAQETGVYLDGVRLNSAAGGAVDLSRIPLGMVKEVDVFKGTTPFALDGSGGGAINIVTNPRRDIASGTFETGSFGHYRIGTVLRRSVGDWIHCLLLDHEQAVNDYPFIYNNGTQYDQSDDSVVRKGNDDFSSISGSYSVTLLPDSVRRVIGSLFFSTYESGIFNPTYAKVEQCARTSGSSVIGTLKADGLRTGRITHGLELNLRMRDSKFNDPLNQFYYGVNKKFHEKEPLGVLRWSAILATMSTWSIAVNASLSAEDWRHFSIVDVNDSIPGFARRIALDQGVEISVVPRDGPELRLRFSCTEEWDTTALAPGFGYLEGMYRSALDFLPRQQAEISHYLSDNLTLFASERFAGRSPTFSERFGRGNGYWGNPELRPEQRLEYDGGVRFKGMGLNATLSWFQGWTWDKIAVLYHNGAFVPDNFGRIDYFGFELETGYTPVSWFSLTNSLTVMRNVFGEFQSPGYVGNLIPYAPEIKDQVVLSLSWGPALLAHRLTYTSPYYVAPDNIEANYIRQLPGCDAWVGLTLGKLFHLTYRLDNYLDVINTDYRDLPRPGRSHHLILTISLP